MLLHRNAVPENSVIQLEASNECVQNIRSADELQRFEGVAFSALGNIIAVAASDTNAVFLFRRKPDGLFEDTPYQRISGPTSRLNYPHDLAFTRSGEAELLAVAQRRGSILVYEKNKCDEYYGIEPVFEISGARTKLNFCDGVTFVGTNDDYLAACNVTNASITFYRKDPGGLLGFKSKPVFQLTHPSLSNPDGLAFSRCGTWLAVANHGNHTVSVFKRRRLTFWGNLKYGRQPITVIKDPELRYPHSVAFTGSNNLVVTNAGANYFSIYAPTKSRLKFRWSQSPMLRKIVGPDKLFRQINAANKQEGGPKGVAIHEDYIAICSPEHGVKIYRFREVSEPGGKAM